MNQAKTLPPPIVGEQSDASGLHERPEAFKVAEVTPRTKCKATFGHFRSSAARSAANPMMTSKKRQKREPALQPKKPEIPPYEPSAEDYHPFGDAEELVAFAREEFQHVVGSKELASLSLPDVWNAAHLDVELMPVRRAIRTVAYDRRKALKLQPGERVPVALYPYPALLLGKVFPRVVTWKDVRPLLTQSGTGIYLAGTGSLHANPLPPIESTGRIVILDQIPWFPERAYLLLLLSRLGPVPWHGGIELVKENRSEGEVLVGLSFDGTTVKRVSAEEATHACL